MFTKSGSENHHLIVAGGYLLEAVDFISPVRIASVQDTCPTWQIGEVTHSAIRHGDLVIRHRDLFNHLGGGMTSDPIGDILLVFRHQLFKEVLVELAEEVLLHLDLLALPLLVILAEMLPVAQLVCPVGLSSVGAAGANKETLQEAESIGTGVVRNVICDLLDILNIEEFMYVKLKDYIDYLWYLTPELFFINTCNNDSVCERIFIFILCLTRFNTISFNWILLAVGNMRFYRGFRIGKWFEVNLVQ